MISQDKMSFLLYTSFFDAVRDLPYDRMGMLFELIFRYELGNMKDAVIDEYAPDVRMAFRFIKGQLDKDHNKWLQTISARSDAGRAGGIAKAIKGKQNQQSVANLANASFAKQSVAKVSKGKQSVANLADNVYVNDSVVVDSTECVRARARKHESTKADNSNTAAQPPQQQQSAAQKFYVKGKTDAECHAALVMARGLCNTTLKKMADGNSGIYDPITGRTEFVISAEFDNPVGYWVIKERQKEKDQRYWISDKFNISQINNNWLKYLIYAKKISDETIVGVSKWLASTMPVSNIGVSEILDYCEKWDNSAD
jgi:hypothetical protein